MIRKRQDGYHDISTCFYPVEWNDVLEIIPSDSTTLRVTGNQVMGESNENLVVKALNLLRENFQLPNFNIYLHKVIPAGAGLGGGSSDGAHMLKLLNEQSNLNVSSQELQRYALELGSDCPFFIENKPMIASGRGEKLEEIPFSLKGKFLIILKPDIHISTAEAYSGVKPSQPKIDIETILMKYNISEWQDMLTNDFEESVFGSHPELLSIKLNLIEHGALYASMSGSGSSIFGIFEDSVTLTELEQKYRHWKGLLN